MRIARRSDSRCGAWAKCLVIGASALALAVAATWYGWNWWTVGRFIQWTDDAYVGGEVTTIAPKVAGFIDRIAIAVTDNEFVKGKRSAGKLDDRDYRAQLARANAAVAVQQATLAEPPGGTGECGTSAVMPAIANAVVAATGWRPRRLPIEAAATMQRG